MQENREAGANPARARRCNGDGCFINATGRAREGQSSPDDPEARRPA